VPLLPGFFGTRLPLPAYTFLFLSSNGIFAFRGSGPFYFSWLCKLYFAVSLVFEWSLSLLCFFWRHTSAQPPCIGLQIPVNLFSFLFNLLYFVLRVLPFLKYSSIRFNCFVVSILASFRRLFLRTSPLSSSFPPSPNIYLFPFTNLLVPSAGIFPIV